VIKKQKYPSYCCQKCGALIGWIGRVLPFHKCKNISLPRGRREWVGLTDEEINLIYAEPQTHIGQYARAIEAKLKEKNT